MGFDRSRTRGIPTPMNASIASARCIHFSISQQRLLSLSLSLSRCPHPASVERRAGCCFTTNTCFSACCLRIADRTKPNAMTLRKWFLPYISISLSHFSTHTHTHIFHLSVYLSVFGADRVTRARARVCDVYNICSSRKIRSVGMLFYFIFFIFH